MKYEYLKGSEKDFEGAPEWATLYTLCAGEDYFFAEFHGVGARVFDVEKKNEFKIDYEFDGSGVDVIAERRPITEPEWDGIGLPPVGCECEVLYDTGRDEWFLAKIIGHDNGSVVGRWLNGDGLYSLFDYSHASCSFRPICSEADKKRDYAVGSIERCWEESTGKIAYQFEAIYYAIAAGKIPGVKLED